MSKTILILMLLLVAGCETRALYDATGVPEDSEITQKLDKLSEQVRDLESRLAPTTVLQGTPIISIPSGRSAVIKATKDDIAVKCLEGK
jgi:hypothetical protein